MDFKEKLKNCLIQDTGLWMSKNDLIQELEHTLQYDLKIYADAIIIDGTLEVKLFECFDNKTIYASEIKEISEVTGLKFTTVNVENGRLVLGFVLPVIEGLNFDEFEKFGFKSFLKDCEKAVQKDLETGVPIIKAVKEKYGKEN